MEFYRDFAQAFRIIDRPVDDERGDIWLEHFEKSVIRAAYCSRELNSRT